MELQEISIHFLTVNIIPCVKYMHITEMTDMQYNKSSHSKNLCYAHIYIYIKIWLKCWCISSETSVIFVIMNKARLSKKSYTSYHCAMESALVQTLLLQSVCHHMMPLVLVAHASWWLDHSAAAIQQITSVLTTQLQH